MNVYIKKQSFVWQKVSVYIAGLIVLIVFLNIFSSQVKNSFLYISSPISRTLLQIGNNLNGTFSFFTDNNSLRQQVDQLTKETQSLLFQNAILQDSLVQGNLEKSINEITKEHHFSLVKSNVVGVQTSASTMTLNKGLVDGISENMPVISAENVVYGKVIKVYNNFCEILLISAKTSVVDVKIQHADPALSANGAIKGDGVGGIYLDLVNADANLQEGDSLVTSGLEGIFPRNLLVGNITSTNSNDIKPFQTARVAPLLNVKTTDTLFIITNYAKK